MELTAMRLFSIVFFISLPLWTVLTVVLILSPSSDSARPTASSRSWPWAPC